MASTKTNFFISDTLLPFVLPDKLPPWHAGDKPTTQPKRRTKTMFSIEHDFDATVITLIDEGTPNLQEDVTINAFEDCIVIEQLDPRTELVERITLSIAQLKDLSAALDLPEGVYQRVREKKD
tara:strand:+ start:104 stop:472 length:369 start_codon:yes stop_codon:yes gene_type:complete